MKITLKDLRNIILEEISEISEDKKKISLWKKLDSDSMDSEIDDFFASSVEKDKQNNLNIEKYAREIYRLLNNYDSLIDVKEVIMKRSLNYIGENYGKESAKKVEDVLSKKFELNLSNKEKDQPSVPVADRAGPGLGG